MIIKSDFRDYYDIGLKHGHDKSRVYERRTAVHKGAAVPEGCAPLAQLLEEASLPRGCEEISFARNDSVVVHSWLLGFCGRMYPVFTLSEEWYWRLKSSNKLDELSSSGTFSMQGILLMAEAWLQERFNNSGRLYKKFLEEFEATRARHYRTSLSPKKAIEGLIEQYRGKRISDEIFVTAGAPVFYYWQETLVCNPRLADTDFIKTMPPIQAFQEIEMYLGGPLAAPDIAPRTVGDDRLIAQQKGFDEQSFRRASPGDRKLRRKQNREMKRKPSD